MDSIMELFQKREVNISLWYYGIQDYATRWEVNNIINNWDIFENIYLDHPLTELQVKDDYYLYLLSCKFVAIKDVIPLLVNNEHKRMIAELSDKAKKAIEEIRICDITKFINMHFHEIFTCEDEPDGIKQASIDLIAKYNNGISLDVFDFLSKQYGYLLINHYDRFEKTFEHSPQLFSNIYPSGHLDEVDSIGLEKTFDIWRHILNKSKSTLNATVIKLINILEVDIKKLCNSATSSNIMRTEGTIRKFYYFLQTIKSPKANEFQSYAKKAADLLSEYVVKEGHSFDFEIPVDEIINKWKRIDKWPVRLLNLTHKINIEDDSFSFVSLLSFIPEAKHHFIDDVSTNIPTDEYFTMSHQQMLSAVLSVGTGTMIGIIRENGMLIEYFNLLASAFSVIIDKLKIEGEYLQQDIEMISAMVQIITNNKDMDKKAMAGMCYGASMFLCGLTEKLMRLFYFSLAKDDIFIPTNKTTLGELFSLRNNYIVTTFGEEHIKHLSYFLQQVMPSGVGLNLRNNLAHWSDISISELTPIFLAQIIWLFTDVLNTIFWYCLSKTEVREES